MSGMRQFQPQTFNVPSAPTTPPIFASGGVPAGPFTVPPPLFGSGQLIPGLGKGFRSRFYRSFIFSPLEGGLGGSVRKKHKRRKKR